MKAEILAGMRRKGTAAPNLSESDIVWIQTTHPMSSRGEERKSSHYSFLELMWSSFNRTLLRKLVFQIRASGSILINYDQ